MSEDDEPRAKAQTGVARDLRSLSIEDLEAHVAALRAEIDRTEAEIGRRHEVRSAADALFKQRPAPAGLKPGSKAGSKAG